MYSDNKKDEIVLTVFDLFVIAQFILAHVFCITPFNTHTASQCRGNSYFVKFSASIYSSPAGMFDPCLL